MKFEVGKKYLLKCGTVPGECKLITEGEYSTVLIVFHNGTVCQVRPDSNDWTEYKELVTITKYAYVIKNELGVVMFDNGLYGNENEARRDFDFSYGEYGYTILAIIPVTYTEENGA
jgi:hypothetical protein